MMLEDGEKFLPHLPLLPPALAGIMVPLLLLLPSGVMSPPRRLLLPLPRLAPAGMTILPIQPVMMPEDGVT